MKCVAERPSWIGSIMLGSTSPTRLSAKYFNITVSASNRHKRNVARQVRPCPSAAARTESAEGTGQSLSSAGRGFQIVFVSYLPCLSVHAGQLMRTCGQTVPAGIKQCLLDCLPQMSGDTREADEARRRIEDSMRQITSKAGQSPAR